MAWPAKQTKQKTLVIGFWALPDNPGGGHLEILNSVTTAKTLFQIKSQPEVPGVGLWTYLWGPPFKPLQTSTESPLPTWPFCAKSPSWFPGKPTPDAAPPPNFWD